MIYSRTLFLSIQYEILIACICSSQTPNPSLPSRFALGSMVGNILFYILSLRALKEPFTCTHCSAPHSCSYLGLLAWILSLPSSQWVASSFNKSPLSAFISTIRKQNPIWLWWHWEKGQQAEMSFRFSCARTVVGRMGGWVNTSVHGGIHLVAEKTSTGEIL